MSEYWTQSTSPAILCQEIARRMMETRAKQEIADALSRERLEFRSLWNCALAVNRLPNKLLIQIFKFAVVYSWPASVFDFLPDEEIEDLDRRFWRLMRICCRWHEVIVGDSGVLVPSPPSAKKSIRQLAVDRALPCPFRRGSPRHRGKHIVLVWHLRAPCGLASPYASYQEPLLYSPRYSRSVGT